MDNLFIIAAIICVIFGVIKFIEMRFINKNDSNIDNNSYTFIRFLLRDILIVYISSVGGIFLLQQLKPMMAEVVPSAQVMAFTDNPSF
jgi:hypothetical protein